MTKGIRDLVLFFALAAVPIVSFWLQDYPDTPFYASMLVLCLLVLTWLKSYHKDTEHQALVDFDENLHIGSLLYIVGGIFGTYITASVIVSAFMPSSLYVPRHNVDMEWFQTFQLNGTLNDFLFQIVMVSPAEELSKLVVHLALYLKLKDAMSKGLARVLAILVPIGFWAILHIYRNPSYQGEYMAITLLSAFVGGLVIFFVMRETKSLLAAILVHAGYNCLIIWVMTNTPQAFAIAVTAFNLLMRSLG